MCMGIDKSWNGKVFRSIDHFLYAEVIRNITDRKDFIVGDGNIDNIRCPIREKCRYILNQRIQRISPYARPR